VPCTAIANRYPFRLGCIADVGQTFNSSTTLQRLLVRSLLDHHDTVGLRMTVGHLVASRRLNKVFYLCGCTLL